MWCCSRCWTSASRCRAHYRNSGWVGGVQLPRRVSGRPSRAVCVAMGEEGRRYGRISSKSLLSCLRWSRSSRCTVRQTHTHAHSCWCLFCCWLVRGTIIHDDDDDDVLWDTQAVRWLTLAASRSYATSLTTLLTNLAPSNVFSILYIYFTTLLISVRLDIRCSWIWRSNEPQRCSKYYYINASTVPEILSRQIKSYIYIHIVGNFLCLFISVLSLPPISAHCYYWCCWCLINNDVIK